MKGEIEYNSLRENYKMGNIVSPVQIFKTKKSKKPGLHRGVARRRPLVKESHEKSSLQFAKSNVGTQHTFRKI